jgi:hypothetical protein
MKHHKAFAACDDGYLSEGYSDAVVRLLAYRWDQFDVLAGLSERNPAFRRWVIRHIDASVSSDEIEMIVRHVGKCSGSTKRLDLCVAIRRAATSALKN